MTAARTLPSDPAQQLRVNMEEKKKRNPEPVMKRRRMQPRRVIASGTCTLASYSLLLFPELIVHRGNKPLL